MAPTTTTIIILILILLHDGMIGLTLATNCNEHKIVDTISMGIYGNEIWQFTDKFRLIQYPYHRLINNQKLFMNDGKMIELETRFKNLWHDNLMQSTIKSLSSSTSNNNDGNQIRIAMQKSDYNKPLLITHLLDRTSSSSSQHNVLLQDLLDEKLNDFKTIHETLPTGFKNLIPIWTTDSNSNDIDENSENDHLNLLMLTVLNDKTLVHTSLLMKEKPLGQLCFHPSSHKTSIYLLHNVNDNCKEFTDKHFENLKFGFIMNNYLYLIDSKNVYYFEISALFNENIVKTFHTKTVELFFQCRTPTEDDHIDKHPESKIKIDFGKPITKPDPNLRRDESNAPMVLIILGVISAITILIIIIAVLYGTLVVYPKRKQEKLLKQLQRQDRLDKSISSSTTPKDNDGPPLATTATMTATSQLSSESSADTTTIKTGKSNLSSKSGRSKSKIPSTLTSDNSSTSSTSPSKRRSVIKSSSSLKK